MATGHKREVTPQMLALIEQLREQGETQESIAQKLGVGITWIKENAWPKLEGRLKPQRGRKKPAPRSDKPARLPECLMRPLSRMGLPLHLPSVESLSLQEREHLKALHTASRIKLVAA